MRPGNQGKHSFSLFNLVTFSGVKPDLNDNIKEAVKQNILKWGGKSIVISDNNYIAKRFEILEGLLSGKTVCNVMIKMLINNFYELAS